MNHLWNKKSIEKDLMLDCTKLALVILHSRKSSCIQYHDHYNKMQRRISAIKI